MLLILHLLLEYVCLIYGLGRIFLIRPDCHKNSTCKTLFSYHEHSLAQLVGHSVFKIILHGTLNDFLLQSISVTLIIAIYQCYSYYFTIPYFMLCIRNVFSLKNEISCTSDTRHLNIHLGHKNVVLAV